MNLSNTERQNGSRESIFTISKVSNSSSPGPRLGLISLPGRNVIETPHYFGNTSRGAIPHVTQDNFARHTAIKGVYVGLEDFIELKRKETPPLYKFQPADGTSALRRFIALPDETFLMLGARRVPPIAAPSANSNTNETVSVFTSVGFRQLETNEYAEAVENLRPDVVLGLGDVPYARVLGSKRIERATDRCIQWLQGHVTMRRGSAENSKSQLFASLLPVSCAKQQYYVDFLADEVANDISGLGVFDLETLEDLPESLQRFPRLALTAPPNPLEVLRQIYLGLDIFVIPFIGSATDAGIAFDFAFPIPESLRLADDRRASPRSIGTDMWSSAHATDPSALSQDCHCHACKHHHRAYIHHLLSAKEMLAWVLLQIHNHHIIDLFFAGARQSITRNTFEQDMSEFARAYQPLLPAKTGKGPRVRGYEFKSEGPGEAKKNASPFTTLNEDKEKLAEATRPSADIGADVLQQQGFAEKQ